MCRQSPFQSGSQSMHELPLIVQLDPRRMVRAKFLDEDEALICEGSRLIVSLEMRRGSRRSLIGASRTSSKASH